MLLNCVFRGISLSHRLYQGSVQLRARGVRRQLLGTLSSQVVEMQQGTHSVKPPNVLVFQPTRDSTSKEFLRVKEGLEMCLSPEHYVVYPIGVDDVLQQSPWKENCRLVVVPPTEHAQWKEYPEQEDAVMKEMVSFVSNGGAMMSMHHELNSLLGLKVKGGSSSSNVRLVQATSEREAGVQSTSEECNIPEFNALKISTSGYHGNSSSSDENESLVISRTDHAHSWPLEYIEGSLERNANHSNNNSIPTTTGQREDVCVQEVAVGTGVAVVSSVDLLPSLPPDLDMKTLVSLKRDVQHRQHFLSVLLQRLGLKCSCEEPPQLTHTYLVCSTENRALFLSSLSPSLSVDDVISGREVNVHIISNDFQQGTPVDLPQRPLSSDLSIISHPAKWQLDSLSFDFLEYFECLKTLQLGRTLLYTSVITSTQTPFTGNLPFCSCLNHDIGVILVAGQQTRGKGRSGNLWISPKGAMMFSMALSFPLSAKLSQRMSLLQHLVAMAMVHGVRTIPGYEDVPIGIKWPNDIYYCQDGDMAKLGGILVSCFTVGSNMTAVIGCGVNLNNKYPTMSVNDCISLHNSSSGSSLAHLSIEGLLARTLNSLEHFLAVYETSEMSQLQELYYKYWLHSGAVVELASDKGQKVTILGIDEFGYLRVKDLSSGEELSVQPDGNTFDIMKGLIAMKTEL